MKSNIPLQVSLKADSSKIRVDDPVSTEKPQFDFGELYEKPVESKDDPVDHPSHYNSGKYEVIDVIEDQGFGEGFCYGSIIKYVLRSKHKKNQKEDLEKAKWFIDRLLMRLK